MRRRPVRPLLLLLLLPAIGAAPACGAAPPPQELAFDIRRVDRGPGSGSLLTIADMDGDGAPDIVAGGERSVVVLRGDGAGGFAAPVTRPAGENPVDAAPGDLDGDGRLDLVVANHETRYVTVLLGGPDGPDGPGGAGSEPAARLPVDLAPHPHAVAVADLDGDGSPDFVVDDRDGERLLAFRGLGDGGFEPMAPIPVGGDPYRGMALRDVDGDGQVDVVTPNPRAVALQLGDGRGGVAPGPRLEAPGLRPFSVAVGDFDGDGRADVAAGSGEGRGLVAVWRGTGGTDAPGFDAVPGSPFTVGDGPATVLAADVTCDGVDDLLVTSYAAGELAVFPGPIAPDRLDPTRIPIDDGPWGLAARDLNGDGRVDVVVSADGGSHVTVLLARAEGGCAAEP